MSERPARPSTALLALVGLLVALGVLGGRLLVRSHRAFKEGLAAEVAGDGPAAVRHHVRAARAHLPGNPWARQALDRLEALAEAGSPALARDALEGARAALLGARVGVGGERLGRVNHRLAVAYAALEAPSETAAAREARVAWHAARLEKRPGLGEGPPGLTLFGLALSVGGVLVFLARGIDAGVRLRRGPALGSGLLFLVGVALFLVGLRLA